MPPRPSRPERRRSGVAADVDASGFEQLGELPGGRLVRVAPPQLVAEHPRVVHHQRVVRAALEPRHTVAPARSEELVVVAAAVTDDRAGDRR